ncbi:MAG: 6-carboxytetrahydropterin synthase [Bdellovibrionaceae bacterium]|nr:6-carboxytetrahydropterin synthase [Pseudobdellovibrionaceae bacterium]
MTKISLSRRSYFSAAHRYYNKQWTEEINKKVFGLCYSEKGHGHNYILDTFVSGPVNKDTGMIINLIDLDALLKNFVNILDHKHLNFDLPYFKTIIPTTENIAGFCFKEIKTLLKDNALSIQLEQIRLYENQDLWVDIINE